MKGATHVYCEVCHNIQPAIFEPLTAPDYSARFLGGDIVCKVCALVIVTLYKKKVKK